MNKNMKNKGITLITLAITIVVLIILAGVSINAVIGDDGIIKKAQDSADLTKESEAKEIINRAILEFYLQNEYETLEDFFNAKVSAGKIDKVEKNADGTLKVWKNGYSVTVENKTNSSNGSSSGGSTGGETQTPEITIGEIKVVADSSGIGSGLEEASTREGKTLYIIIESSITGGTTLVEPQVPYAVTENGIYKFIVTGTVKETTYKKEVSVTVNQFRGFLIDDIQIGDGVNYTYDTASSYSLASKYSGYSSSQTITQTTGLKWKVLNVNNENGTVEIISTKPTSSPMDFKGALGYYNGPYLMNEICKAQYSNIKLGVNARSINLLDMEKHLTETGITNRNAYKSAANVQYGTTKTYTSDTLYPSLYANQKGAGPNVTAANASSISQPDLTKGNDPYGESKAIATTEPTTSSSSSTGSPLTITQTFYEISIDETNYGAAASVLADSTLYWVASRDVNTQPGYARFCLRLGENKTNDFPMFDSDTGPYGYHFGLRPVVSLPYSLFTGEQDENGAWNLSK